MLWIDAGFGAVYPPRCVWVEAPQFGRCRIQPRHMHRDKYSRGSADLFLALICAKFGSRSETDEIQIARDDLWDQDQLET